MMCWIAFSEIYESMPLWDGQKLYKVRTIVVGFVVRKAALGQVFSEYFGFPYQSFHQFLHHNHPGQAQ
jgi:hypothetical protein